MHDNCLEMLFLIFIVSVAVTVVVVVVGVVPHPWTSPLLFPSLSHTNLFPLHHHTTFCRPSLAAAEETTTAQASTGAATTAPPSSSSSSSSSSERFEAADFSLTVPAGFGLAEVAKAGYTPTTAEERGARGRGIAAPDSPVKVRFTAPAAEGGGGSGGSNGGGGNGGGNNGGSSVGSSELSVIVRDAAAIKPTFLMVSDISQWGDAAAVGALLLPRGVTVTRASTERVELPARDTGSIAGVVASPPQTAYLYEFEDRRGDLFVTLAAVARAGKVYVVAGSARGPAAWEARREGMREAVRSFRVTPTLR